MSSAGAQEQEQPLPAQLPVVQYVVLRKDLYSDWGLGPVIAQACHASVAAIALGLEQGCEHTAAYCAADALDSMHKVVLEAKDEAQLRAIASKLAAAGIAHKLWVEQPEAVATALATRPCPKADVAPHLKKLPLCKSAIGG